MFGDANAALVLRCRSWPAAPWQPARAVWCRHPLATRAPMSLSTWNSRDPKNALDLRDGSGQSTSFDVAKATERLAQRARFAARPVPDVDVGRVAAKTLDGLYSGAPLAAFDTLAVNEAAAFVAEEPNYGRFAASLLTASLEDEVRSTGATSFLQGLTIACEQGLVRKDLVAFVGRHEEALNALLVDALGGERFIAFDYFGLRTVYDRYLLRHPTLRIPLETAPRFFLRIACALSLGTPTNTVRAERALADATDLFGLFAELAYLPSSPTLFNSGTMHEQLSSCFLLDSPEDKLEDIYRKYTDVALLSKFSGGIGLAFHRVRSRGSLIVSTNGHSNGIVPWLKTLDASVAAVNQGGKRKGACCVYLENWHADIEEFLELRENTGDDARRTHNLNLANWISDLFFRRVEADEEWSLFDPKTVPEFPDLYGEAFEAAYVAAEKAGKAVKKMRARDLYARMMRTLAQTGNGWITFKDASNRACNQTALPGRVVHLSNLCTEILEVTDADETAVCNLGSIQLGRHLKRGSDGTLSFDDETLARTVRIAVRQLDRVIDRNLYPIATAKHSNLKWRPIGLGVMGLQDLFFQLGYSFDAPEARALSAHVAEEIYFHALSASCELAEEAEETADQPSFVARGPHATFKETRAARGELQFDAWGITPKDTARWDALRERIKTSGLRNSLLVAIAPTATIASIAGAYECIEPQLSNLFKRETLSGDFLQVNRYLVGALKERGLWTDDMRNKIKLAEGSVQAIEEIPADLRQVFRTVWEIPMRSLIDMAADRGAFIDQSQSLNLFMETPNIGALSSMYFYAWKKKLKTTYYLRSRPATRIAKTTVHESPAPEVKTFKSADVIACSLENPESCEACQ